MKLKLMLMFAGVMAAVAIAITPLAASAQNNSPAQQPPHSEQSPQKPTRTRIVLTPQQQEKFQQIQASAIGEIEAVLTAEQKNQFAAGRENGQGLEAITNLSESQVGKIQGILQKLNDQIGELLTDEQKQQIQQQSQSN